MYEYNYKVGDKVRIVDKWNGDCCQNQYGKMDKWLGKVMTIRGRMCGGYLMVEDSEENNGSGWAWTEEAIEGLAEEEKPSFKVGDRVRIRQWDDMEREFGLDKDGDIKSAFCFTRNMARCCGETARIVKLDNISVRLCFDDDRVDNIMRGYCLSTDLLEHDDGGMTLERAKEHAKALMGDLHYENDIAAVEKLLETVEELERKHWQECQQIAKYADERSELSAMLKKLLEA